MSTSWRSARKGDFAVIGDPVAHSLSPRMHMAAFAAMNLPYTYRAIQVAPGEVAEAVHHLASLGYKGLNVTVPLKAEARAVALLLDGFTRRCGAVNTLRLDDHSGVNTDGSGFLDTIEGMIPAGSKVLMLGAGGSARAIALALVLGGYNLCISNRTPERAHALVRELAIEAEVVENPELKDVRLIVNATTASLNGESPAISFAGAPADAVAYDLVYGDTPFLRSAFHAGLRTIDGKPLLVAQGARSLEFWLGRPAPRDVMMEAIR